MAPYWRIRRDRTVPYSLWHIYFLDIPVGAYWDWQGCIRHMDRHATPGSSLMRSFGGRL